MSRIDPIRRSDLARRAAQARPEQASEAEGGQVVRLPVPLERVSRIAPREDRAEGQSAFAAQLMGQEGQKRGLRAGPQVIDQAKSLYNRTEWSGARDRRAPKGAYARTQA